MSKEDNAAGADSTEQMDRMLDSMTQKKEENESQFQKLGDVVEADDDNGVVEIESLCMNCHENVCFPPPTLGWSNC
jgi:zinc finger protein